MSDELQIRRVKAANDADVKSLIAKSDEYLSALYPPESNHAESLDALVAAGVALFAGYADGRIAACGGVKLVRERPPYGEIKRLFVDDAYRAKGFATVMMKYLENYLREYGVTICRLEAGPMQPQALRLYEKLGYRETGPFGAYEDDPQSVFLEKILPA